MHSGKTNGSSDPHPLNRELPFHIGDWRVDPLNNQLQHADSTVKLEPKVMDVLIYLAMHQGQVVSREELEEHVWAGRVVTYDAITAAVVKLRKAFHANGQSEPFIKTVSKRGYCLTAQVDQSSSGEATMQPAEVLVTPALEAGGESTDVETSNGGTSGVSPSRSRKQRVLLGTALIIVLGIGGVYLFTPPDVSPPTTHSDNPPLPPPSPASRPVDPEALKAFNAGWKKFNEQTPAAYKVAIPLMQRAIVLDPDFGQPYAAVAAIYWKTWLYSWQVQLGTSPLPHTLELADAALQQAMSHPTALAYQVSSEMLYINRRYTAAIDEARKAITLEPNNALGYAALAKAQVFAGLPDQATINMDKAMQLDPNRPSAYLFTRGLIYFNTERFEQAAATLEQALRGSAQNHLIYVPLIAAYGQLGEQEKVTPLLQEANRLRKACQLPLLTVSTPTDYFPYQAWPFKNKEDVTRLQEGLKAAGLPQW